MERFNSKRMTALLLAGAMCLSALVGCGAKEAPAAAPAQPQTETAAEAPQKEETAVEETAAPAEETAGVPEEAPEEAEELDLDGADGSTGPDVDLGALLDEGVPLAASPAMGTVLTPEAPGKQTKSNSSAVIDYSNSQDGYIMVKWSAGGTPKVKVLIKGPNAGKGTYDSYQYNLRTDGQYEAFPLSDGSGKYTVGVYKNTSGTQYATICTASIDVKLTNEFVPYLRPNQYVTYAEGSETVKKAAEICAGATDNLDKVEKVYEYVVKNVTYDKQKAKTVKSGYLPVVDDTLKTKKGICFDYAALMSAMLRSQNVPVKLIVGYTGDVYHAWINVWSETEGWIESKIYFDGKEWKLMDPTFASSGKQSASIMEYIGNGSNYSAKYQY